MADSTTNLDLITTSQGSKEVTADALFDAGSPATYFARRATTTVGLTWGYYGAVIAGSATRIPNGTIALTGSATNYLYATSVGVVTKATSPPAGWPNALAGSAIPMYEIVTGPSSVTSYKDWRQGGAGGAGTTYSNFVGDNGGSPNSGVAGLVPPPNQGDAAAGKYLKADGTWATIPFPANPDFVGDNGGSPNSGVHGLVPAPNQGDAAKFLRGDGTWATVSVAGLPNFIGDDGGSPNSGVKGLVPAPNQGDSAKVLKGDGTWSSVGTTMISASAVTNAKLADMVAHTFKMRNTNSTGAPEDGTATQATALLDNVVGDSGTGGTKGLVPAPAAGDAAAAKFLNAAGAWSVPAGVGSSALNVTSPAYAATVTIDLTTFSNYPFVVANVGTLTGNITLNITNGFDGQVIRVWLTQNNPGGQIFTAGANLHLSTDTPLPVLSTGNSAVDALAFQWRSIDGKAWLTAINHGY